MAKIVNAKVGEPICFVNANGNEIPAQISANLKDEGYINLVCWPSGSGSKHVQRVPHYNVDGARTGQHWKKAT